MRINELTKINYQTHWLTCNYLGEIGIQKKDSLTKRWLKTFFQILTFFSLDPYGHVRIKWIAKGLFDHFIREPDPPQAKKEYLKVVNALLNQKTTLIRTDRTALKNLKRDLLAYQKVS